MTDTQPTADTLLPCPWCGGGNLKTFRSRDGDVGVVEYVQCMDCTSCGPDHKNGRHWNTQPALTDLRASLRREENSQQVLVRENQRLHNRELELLRKLEALVNKGTNP